MKFLYLQKVIWRANMTRGLFHRIQGLILQTCFWIWIVYRCDIRLKKLDEYQEGVVQMKFEERIAFLWLWCKAVCVGAEETDWFVESIFFFFWIFGGREINFHCTTFFNFSNWRLSAWDTTRPKISIDLDFL